MIGGRFDFSKRMSQPQNATEGPELPDLSDLPAEMRFTDENAIIIGIYCNLIWISLLGNLTVFVAMLKVRRRTRVHLLLLNLCVADLLVTVIEMPLQIAWKWTVSWTFGGDFTCRLLASLRVFGLYLSAMLLIVSSIDRFLAVTNPLVSERKARRRTIQMIVAVWPISAASASLQSIVFHLAQHPNYSWYSQCVTFGAFTTPGTEIAYGIYVMLLTYGFPLLVIIACYTGIWVRLHPKSSPRVEDSSIRIPAFLRRTSHVHLVILSQEPVKSANWMYRLRGNTARLKRAKHRTLKMMVMIVGTFLLCRTPYQILSLLYMSDKGSSIVMDYLTQEIIFIFGVISSVVNPYLYGLYSMGIWKHLRRKKNNQTNCTVTS